MTRPWHKINRSTPYFGFFLLMLNLLLAACATPKPNDVAWKDAPDLKIEEYFLGPTKAYGIVEDRWGKLRKSFTVDMNGYYEGEQFILDEHFAYSDGTTEHRLWRITKLDDLSYTGVAEGVIGKAVGKRFGNVLNWQYDLTIQVGERPVTVHFDDWMYQMNDRVLLNRARFSKFGFEVGSVTLAFEKPDQKPEQKPDSPKAP
jgi:hypothetical protein